MVDFIVLAEISENKIIMKWLLDRPTEPTTSNREFKLIKSRIRHNI